MDLTSCRFENGGIAVMSAKVSWIAFWKRYVIVRHERRGRGLEGLLGGALVFARLVEVAFDHGDGVRWVFA